MPYPPALYSIGPHEGPGDGAHGKGQPQDAEVERALLARRDVGQEDGLQQGGPG